MKLEPEFFIIERTWNRNIMRGPFANGKAADVNLELLVSKQREQLSKSKGGPVRFSIVKTVETVRVVRRGGGLVGVERTPKGRRK